MCGFRPGVRQFFLTVVWLMPALAAMSVRTPVGLALGLGLQRSRRRSSRPVRPRSRAAPQRGAHRKARRADARQNRRRQRPTVCIDVLQRAATSVFVAPPREPKTCRRETRATIRAYSSHERSSSARSSGERASTAFGRPLVVMVLGLGSTLEWLSHLASRGTSHLLRRGAAPLSATELAAPPLRLVRSRGQLPPLRE